MDDFGLDYAASLESPDIVELKDEYGLFIDGRFTPGQGESFLSMNPATGKSLASFASADEDDVDRAVRAAARALPKWQALAPAERAKHLFRIARLLQERSREFAVAEVLYSGKPIREARDFDVPTAVNHFFYYAGWADKLPWAFPASRLNPVGVCGQIIPWNFPLLMTAWKIAPALACGNTVVLKPAEQTSLTAMLLAELLAEAELPAGVVNIISGGPETGRALTTHPAIDKIAFTGSTEVGKLIARQARPAGKRLTLELGGKAANIVFADAALDQAIEGVIDGIYFNQGHVCCAGSRLLVQESVAEEFLGKLKQRMGLLRVGNPLDKNTDIGAINSSEQLERIDALMRSGQAEGARLFQPEQILPKGGYWCRPSLFEDVAPTMQIAREEIFGPVLAAMTFRTADEAIALANQTAYGLSAGLWTQRGSRALMLARELKAGVVWSNCYNRFDPAAAFGGYKESGYGREGGRAGLAPYLEISHA